jgi:hypothetical protein
MTYKEDYKQGKLAEDIVYNDIKPFFKDNIIKINSRYSKYDYEGDKYIYELKTRNNCYSSFPTTLIPYDKIIKDSQKRQIFLFNFKDGLYYIKYREKKFKKFDLNTFCRYKRPDYNDVEKLYYYIPIEKLKPIINL